MIDLSDVILRPSDFATLAMLCQFDPKFPSDFDSWLTLIEQADKQARERSLFPVPLLLDPETFALWCRTVAIVPCIDALRAYAIIQRGQHDPERPGTPTL